MTDKEVSERLSSRGIRPTQQRIAVYGYLLRHPVHPSADTIYQALTREFPVFSRTTIYNTLDILTKAGLVRPVSISPDEQRYDAETKDHGHFLCRECGEILDFSLDASLLASICPPGCEKEQGDVFFTGLCPSCARKRHTEN